MQAVGTMMVREEDTQDPNSRKIRMRWGDDAFWGCGCEAPLLEEMKISPSLPPSFFFFWEENIITFLWFLTILSDSLHGVFFFPPALLKVVSSSYVFFCVSFYFFFFTTLCTLNFPSFFFLHFGGATTGTGVAALVPNRGRK